MLATTPLFCYTDWPRRFFARFPAFLRGALPFTTPNLEPSSSCIYPEVETTGTPPVAKTSKLRLKHKIGAIFTILYITEQFFLPYSHFITQVQLPLIFYLGSKQLVRLCLKQINKLLHEFPLLLGILFYSEFELEMD